MNTLSKKMFCAMLFIAVTTISFGQFGGSMIKVTVAPDHFDWTYSLNEKAKFNVQVTKYGNLIENAVINYEAGPEMFPDVKEEGVVLKNGTTTLTGSMKTAGFYRVRVWTIVDGMRYEGLGTAAFAPETIKPTATDPADFDAFWAKAIEEARRTELSPILTLIPELCTSTVNAYHISFQNGISRIYGMLAMPKKQGKYPAILKVPGAGIRAYTPDVTTAARGFIVLDIGIHGIPVNLNPQVYNDLNRGGLAGYNSVKMNDKDNHYYKRVYVGCVRAVDFIYALPEFNGNDVAVTGGSQGGALSIVTAGLDKRIKFLAPLYPALCDHTGYLNHRAGGWPHYFSNREPRPNEVETLSYYDVVNFARRVTVPGYYAWGYNDTTCPPTSMYSAYNVITAQKELHIYQETGHWNLIEETLALNEWLFSKLQR